MTGMTGTDCNFFLCSPKSITRVRDPSFPAGFTEKILLVSVVKVPQDANKLTPVSEFEYVTGIVQEFCPRQ